MRDSNVAIVVVNYNGAAFLPELAESLAAVTYPHQRLYLVDNASTDGSDRQLASLFPDADIIYSPVNGGWATGVNLALSRCLAPETDFVLLLNPDCTVEPDFLAHLVRAADARTLLAPRVLSLPAGLPANFAGRLNWRGALEAIPDDLADPRLEEPVPVAVFTFACVLIPVAALRAVGPIEERFGMYYEDTDYCLRARRAGFRLAVYPQAVVRHREGASSGGPRSPFTHYYATRNLPFLMRRHAGAVRYALFTAYFLFKRVDAIYDYARRGNWLRARIQLLALRDFYTGRMGMTYVPSNFPPERRRRPYRER